MLHPLVCCALVSASLTLHGFASYRYTHTPEGAKLYWAGQFHAVTRRQAGAGETRNDGVPEGPLMYEIVDQCIVCIKYTTHSTPTI
jgi:hypothetical protein